MKSLSPVLDTMSVIRVLHIIAHQTDEIFDTILRNNFGLTLARFRILLPLIEIGPLTQADIARFNFLTEASVARQVRMLHEEGFVKRVCDKTDARKFTLTLTKKTEALLPKIKAELNTEIETVYQGLSLEELQTLQTLLSKLRTLGTAYSGSQFICPG